MATWDADWRRYRGEVLRIVGYDTLLPKIPQYIAEADGGGSDTYMLLRRMIELDPVEPALQASTPLEPEACAAPRVCAGPARNCPSV